MRHNYGKVVAQKFWGCAYAKTEPAFDKVLSEIRELSDKAAEYISRLSRERWVPYAVTSARYGYITSNILESQNAAWLPAYNLPALYTMLSIWNNLGEKYYERQRKRQPTSPLTNSPWKYICSEEMEASRYKLISFSEGIAHVSTPSGAAHLVNLHEGTCTCLEFQDRHLPCCHAMAVCKDQVLDPEEFTSSIYTVANYRNIYSEKFALNPIQVEDLEDSACCLAPLVKKTGRPQKNQLRRSAQKKNRAKRHCTICGSENHN